MNQYERIVSYIYQYENHEKGSNVGYAKLEKRGNQCRLAVQVRAVAMNEIPTVYLYRQQPEGIVTVTAGIMTFRGNNLFWKGTTEADGMFQSDWSLAEVDGIFIDGADKRYFATSWKQDNFFLGEWNKDSTNAEQRAAGEAEQEEKKHEILQEKRAVELKKPEESRGEAGLQEKKHTGENVKEGMLEEKKVERKNVEKKNAESGATEVEEIQMQSICGVCPFKRRVSDYGKRLLMTFPSMKPFPTGIAKACVRMELQDIGCLPITTWSLSGNRFLLHGYSCYRHLLFAQLQDGKYVLGVPGVFSEREEKNAFRFGFSDFQPLGETGQMQGAFGYWFLELPTAAEVSAK